MRLCLRRSAGILAIVLTITGVALFSAYSRDLRHVRGLIVASTGSEVFTLAPDQDPFLGLSPGTGRAIPNDLPCAETIFRGYQFTAHKTLNNSDQQSLIKALTPTLSPKDLGAAICFTPGFGLRFHHDSGPLDLLVCYDCSHVLVRTPSGTSCWLAISRESLETVSRLAAHPNQ